MSHGKQPGMAYALHSQDGRVHVTLHSGRPTYVYVTHDGLTEGEVDAALMEMAAQIPSPCLVIVFST